MTKKSIEIQAINNNSGTQGLLSVRAKIQNHILSNFGIKSNQISGLSSESKEFINKNIGGDQVQNRIILLRHADTGIQGYQTDFDQLSEHGLSELDSIIEELVKRSGLNSQNVDLLFCDGNYRFANVERVTQTANRLINKLGINKENLFCDVEGLDTSIKSDDQTGRLFDMATKSSIFINEFISIIHKNKIVGKNFLMIVHKSNISGLVQTILKPKNKEISIGKIKLQNSGILSYDITQNGEILQQQNNYLSLYINNVEQIIHALDKEKLLKSIIDSFINNDVQLFELQNYVNAYFRSNQSLFNEYLLSTQPDIRQFCAINLIRLNNGQVVFDNLLQLLELAVNQGRIDTLLNIFETLNQSDKEKFIKIISKNVRSKDVSNILNSNENNLNNFISYAKFMHPGINFLRKRSLDSNINQGNSLPMAVKFDNGKYDNIEKLISEKGITLIEGEAGAGKSIKMLEILEYCAANSKYAMYINLGECCVENLQGVIDGNEKYKRADVILLDALDESRYSNDEKKELFKIIKDLSINQNVIISSRPGNLPQFEVEEEKRTMPQLELLKLKPLELSQIDEYVKKTLDKDQINIWNQFKENEFIKEIESNPLILNMLCNLIANNEDLSGIKCKGDLYEKIIDLRLNDWESIKPNRDGLLKKDDKRYKSDKIKRLQNKKNLLKELAFEFYSSTNGFTENQLNHLFDLYDFSEEIDCLNLIFRKGENGNYQFVHQSFMEYFFAKQIWDNYIKTNKIDIHFLSLSYNHYDDAYIHYTNIQEYYLSLKDDGKFYSFFLKYNEYLINNGFDFINSKYVNPEILFILFEDLLSVKNNNLDSSKSNLKDLIIKIGNNYDLEEYYDLYFYKKLHLYKEGIIESSELITSLSCGEPSKIKLDHILEIIKLDNVIVFNDLVNYLGKNYIYNYDETYFSSYKSVFTNKESFLSVFSQLLSKGSINIITHIMRNHKFKFSDSDFVYKKEQYVARRGGWGLSDTFGGREERNKSFLNKINAIILSNFSKLNIKMISLLSELPIYKDYKLFYLNYMDGDDVSYLHKSVNEPEIFNYLVSKISFKDILNFENKVLNQNENFHKSSSLLETIIVKGKIDLIEKYVDLFIENGEQDTLLKLGSKVNILNHSVFDDNDIIAHEWADALDGKLLTSEYYFNQKYIDFKNLLYYLYNLKNKLGCSLIDFNKKDKEGNNLFNLVCAKPVCNVVRCLLNFLDDKGEFVIDVTNKNKYGNDGFNKLLDLYSKNTFVIKLKELLEYMLKFKDINGTLIFNPGKNFSINDMVKLNLSFEDELDLLFSKEENDLAHNDAGDDELKNLSLKDMFIQNISFNLIKQRIESMLDKGEIVELTNLGINGELLITKFLPNHIANLDYLINLKDKNGNHVYDIEFTDVKGKNIINYLIDYGFYEFVTNLFNTRHINLAKIDGNKDNYLLYVLSNCDVRNRGKPILMSGDYPLISFIKFLIDLKGKDGQQIFNYNTRNAFNKSIFHYLVDIMWFELFHYLMLKNDNGTFNTDHIIYSDELFGYFLKSFHKIKFYKNDSDSKIPKNGEKVFLQLVNLKDEKGNYIFDLNKKYGSGISVSNILIKNGFYPLLLDLLKNSRLDIIPIISKSYGKKHIIQYLLDSRDTNDFLLELLDISFIHIDLIKYLLTLKDTNGKPLINLNQKYKNGETLFIRICNHDEADLVHFICDLKDVNGKRYVDLSLKDKNGNLLIDNINTKSKLKYFENRIKEYLHSLIDE